MWPSQRGKNLQEEDLGNSVCDLICETSIGSRASNGKLLYRTHLMHHVRKKGTIPWI